MGKNEVVTVQYLCIEGEPFDLRGLTVSLWSVWIFSPNLDYNLQKDVVLFNKTLCS